jgi:iron-sulfur cluster assembly accessory protein
MLQLTDNAVAKVKVLMAADGKEGYGLRVAVRGGGCSGFQYQLSYERAARDNDEVLDFDGLAVYLDPMSQLYLEDVKIDYLDSLQESGFKILNPKASGTCGCGSSFSM